MSNETYGVGDSAKSKNIGATHNAESRIHDDGSVTDKNDGKVFDPKDDVLELKQKDGDLSDQAEGKDEGPKSFDQTSRTKRVADSE